MANSNTTFVFDGAIGNQSKTVVQCISDMAAAGTLRTFLEAHTDGKVNAVSFSDRVVYDGVPGVTSNTDEIGVVYMQDIDTGNVIRVSIPAIKGADTEQVPGRDGGRRTTDAFNALLKAAMETATGRDFRMLYGVILTKK